MHQLNAQLSPRPARRVGFGTPTSWSVSWLNPSGVWQQIYSGNDGNLAQASAAEYETQGYAVDAWVLDDQAGWQLQHWSSGSVGAVLPPKPAAPTSGSNPLLVGGIIAAGCAAGGLASWWAMKPGKLTARLAAPAAVVGATVLGVFAAAK